MPRARRVPAQDQRRPPASSRSDRSVFLNIPYDSQFEKLYLAYIAGVTAFGFAPRAAIEIPGGQARLERIFELVASCRYSIHDLSRVQLERSRPRVPRFNMPFELGMAVAWEKASGEPHVWFVCEEQGPRLEKSLSDLKGIDPYIHAGTINGLFRQLSNAFIRSHRQPTILQFRTVYAELRRRLPRLLHDSGARSPFEARVFKDLCILASTLADEIVR